MKPKAYSGKNKKAVNTGGNFRSENGAYITNQVETTVERKNQKGNKLKVIEQATEKLTSVMRTVDGGTWVMFNKQGGYLQTMMKKLFNQMIGTRLSIDHRGNDFVVDVKVKKAMEEGADGFRKSRKTRRKENDAWAEVDILPN